MTYSKELYDADLAALQETLKTNRQLTQDGERLVYAVLAIIAERRANDLKGD